MMCNVGRTDRIVRALSAIVLMAFALLFIPTTVPKVVLLAIGTLLLLSASVGICLVYRVLGMNTARPRSEMPPASRA